MEMQTFQNAEFGSIRTMMIDDQAYFVGKDVAEILGYERPTKAIMDHIDVEDRDEVPIQDSIGRMQNTPIINESGLYSLILSSKMPAAKKFKRWVTSEVLPSIRKHGAYITPATVEEILSDPDTLIRLATELKEARQERDVLAIKNSTLTVQNVVMQPKADYFDELVDRNLLTNMRNTAKALGVKQNQFIGFLLEKGYLYRDAKGALMPYAEKNNGLFDLKESFNERTSWTGYQTLITPKGRETFRLLLEGQVQKEAVS